MNKLTSAGLLIIAFLFPIMAGIDLGLALALKQVGVVDVMGCLVSPFFTLYLLSIMKASTAFEEVALKEKSESESK